MLRMGVLCPSKLALAALAGGAGREQAAVREARSEATAATWVKSGEVPVKASHCTRSKGRNHYDAQEAPIGRPSVSATSPPTSFRVAATLTC